MKAGISLAFGPALVLALLAASSLRRSSLP